MVMYGPGSFLYVIFLVITWVTMFYSLNFYYLAIQSRHNESHERRKRQVPELPATLLPTVTIQLPLYNEKYVARRLIDAVCKMDYPKNKMQIQVLDDSDDDTVDLIRSIVDEYRFKGFDIVHVRRGDRSGYKAGALKAGMKTAKGEFIAIFDADFIPPSSFLKHLLRYFSDPKMGFVQCKWGHVNEDYSSMTQAQAVSLDLHFLVEQKAKSLSRIFLNFNGTAGIWRTSCINDAGGWQTTTLVEDMDLSYRAQMKGWKCMFLDDYVVNAELPVQMNAAKRQQFRWAKGSIQVALKLLTDVIAHRKVPVESKVQSFIHMTRHVAHPFFLAQFLIFPMLLSMDYKLYESNWAPLFVLAMYAALGPGGYLVVINKVWKKGWKHKAMQFMFLHFFGAGISVNNSVAVFDALFGRKSEFLRTPKFGIVKKGEEWRNKEYALPFTKTTLLEIFFALYGCISIFVAIFSNNALFTPLIALPTIGFIYVAYLSIAHSQLGKRKKKTTTATIAAGQALAPVQNSGRTLGQRLLLPSVLAFLILGAGVAYYGYHTSIYPLQEASGFLARAQTAQTPQQLADYARLAQKFIPESGNPVWLFPTFRTDFEIMHMQLDSMVERSEIISSLSTHDEGYNAALIDMHSTALEMQASLHEAIPYIYVSPQNIALGAAWIGIILSVFAAMKRARTRHQRAETASAVQT
ncbi:glycosyl transferase [Candidatus Nitrososphaera evergladensis SR1]|uniref:Glycosyl transferase n=1 Tax=Candidatus Nitrososphaera evergladensis SR1 TaxID=1459636 RepID=A0A075MQE0_9ARCH|nr:glycosyltransferase [Candidatus Nitrososphaera evergladensis]AIF83423.1 glycosyl transferase [Candidatus Nitrososphaera evergladensis SR1]